MSAKTKDDSVRGTIHIFGVIVVAVFLYCVWPTVNDDRPRSGRRSACKTNLREIVLALHNYHDTQGSFPPAYIADANGKPIHSWRALILPYIEKGKLFEDYRFDEPWDGPNNRKLADEIDTIFHCPNDKSASPTETNYVVVVGPNSMFPPSGATRMGDMRNDGNQDTILVVEMANSGI